MNYLLPSETSKLKYFVIENLDQPFILDCKYIASKQQSDGELRTLLQGKDKGKCMKVQRGDFFTWCVKDPIDSNRPKTYIPN